MSLFTRGVMTRTWGVSGTGLEVPPVNGWRGGIMVRGGEIPVILPPPAVVMDPSDPATWTVPVRWT